MINKIFKDYIQFRKELNVHNFFHYFWKILFPLIFAISVNVIFYNFADKINHKDIATILVSTNSVITAFLVLSLTVLLTQGIKNLPNSNIDYKKFLITNVEMSVILIFTSITISLFYMLLSSSNICSMNFILNITGFISVFITMLVITLSIYDLLLLSSRLK
ncbi:hypothetical protein [Poseidonibacter antarcticus]|uniref:hypothetical protein n=1 Tax=Poseidonibacter antarcticus TaxID=2478538 RepID=UPI000EF450B2|nr:hypothetical protein [Poseidonibacter antarcticus]